MKKITNIIIVGFIVSFIGINLVYAWDDCPKGEVNDPYPGECSQYVDTDNDGICDRSQPAPEDRIAQTKSDENTYTAVPIIENETDNADPTVSPTNQVKNNAVKEIENNSKYNFWIISIVLIIIYVISFTLSKTNKISVVAHRKFWNILLLATFLVCGITGLLLTIKIENPGLLNLPQNFLFLHVEFGIVMALISIFHILWHWPYYKSMLKSKNNNPPSDSYSENKNNSLK